MWAKLLTINNEQDLDEARRDIENSMPAEHLDFFHALPFYHEDDFAIYVHAGLDRNETSARNFAAVTALDARHGFL